MSTPESLASDPNTDLSTLGQLAFDHPELQEQIAENPSTYPDLLTWIANYGTPEGASAASKRLISDAKVSTSTDDETVLSSFAPQEPVKIDDETVLSTYAAPEPAATDDETVLSTYAAPEPADTTVTEADVKPFLTRSPTALPPPLPEVDAAASKRWAETRTMPMGAPLPPPQGTPTTLPVPGLAPPSQPPAFAQTDPRGLPAGYPQAPPSPQAHAGTSDGEKKGGTTVVLLGVLIGVLVAFIVAGAAWFLVLRDSSAGDADAQTMAEADAAATAAKALAEKEEAEAARLEAERELAQMQAEADAAEQRKDGAATDNQVRYPAPANAVTAPWFISPSGNIACQLDASGATCTIYEAEFGLSAPGCTRPPYTIIADGDSTRWDCSMRAVPNDTNGPILEYSTSSTTANSACLSTVRGMTCWDTVSGYSFAIARQGFMMSSNGLIPETEFPWR